MSVKFTPTAGLWKSNDSLPTSVELTAKACLIDANTTVDCTDYLSTPTSSGVDLGSAQEVEYLIIYLTTAVKNISTPYYSANTDSFSVYYSSDNSTWTLKETFDAPALTASSGKTGNIKLTLASSQSARYFKIRADTGGWAQDDGDENWRVCEVECYGVAVNVTKEVPVSTAAEIFYAPFMGASFVPASAAAETFYAPFTNPCFPGTIDAAETFNAPVYHMSMVPGSIATAETFNVPVWAMAYLLPALYAPDEFPQDLGFTGIDFRAFQCFPNTEHSSHVTVKIQNDTAGEGLRLIYLRLLLHADILQDSDIFPNTTWQHITMKIQNNTISESLSIYYMALKLHTGILY